MKWYTAVGVKTEYPDGKAGKGSVGRGMLHMEYAALVFCRGRADLQADDEIIEPGVSRGSGEGKSRFGRI